MAIEWLSTISVEALRQRIGVASFCDDCSAVHNVLVDHCTRGDHCVSFDATCNADWRHEDHGRQCCVCKGFVKQLAPGFTETVTPHRHCIFINLHVTQTSGHMGHGPMCCGCSGLIPESDWSAYKQVDPLNLRGRL